MSIFLGSFFYIGYLPIAPGTWASLVSLFPIYLIAVSFGLPGLVIFLFISCLITILTTPEFERVHGKDPPPMVTDEVSGQALTYVLIPLHYSVHDLSVLLTGFLLFRLFDIFKPLGINRIQKLEGAPGVLADDLLAGLYAFICLKILILIFS